VPRVNALSTSRMQEIAQLLSQAERHVTGGLAGVLAESSVEQWRTLTLLADRAGHPMSEIADYAMLPAPSLTRLIDRMVSDGLVYRKVDPSDRRRVLVHNTARGERLRQTLSDRIDRVQEAVLGHVAADQLEQLAAVLAKLIEPAGASDSRPEAAAA
jgi:DNA-binding MarR family transcriptional regulator